MHSGTLKPQQRENAKETKRSWLANPTGRMSKSPAKMGVTDEMSLLSDTSLGEAESHITYTRILAICRDAVPGFCPGFEVGVRDKGRA